MTNRSNIDRTACARSLLSFSVADIISSIIAPDRPSPARGATSRLSTRTCSAVTWAFHMRAIISAVVRAASPAAVPVSGSSTCGSAMVRPVSGVASEVFKRFAPNSTQLCSAFAQSTTWRRETEFTRATTASRAVVASSSRRQCQVSGPRIGGGGTRSTSTVASEASRGLRGDALLQHGSGPGQPDAGERHAGGARGGSRSRSGARCTMKVASADDGMAVPCRGLRQRRDECVAHGEAGVLA